MILYSLKIFSGDLLFKHAPVATIVVDEKLNILMVNPAGQKLLGYPEEALIQKSLAVIMPPMLQDEHVQRMKDKNSQEPSRIIGQNRPVSVMKADGSYVSVILSVNELNISNKTYYIGTLADSTVITSKTAEIEKSNHYLDQILNFSKDFICIFSDRGYYMDIFSANKEKMLMPYEFMIGKNFRDILRGDLKDQLDMALSEALKTNQEQSFEFNYTNEKNQTEYYLSTVNRFEIPGEISGYINTVKEITDLKSKELALEEARDLSIRKEEEKTNMISVVSHEMRNAINKILGFASLGLTGDTPLNDLLSYLKYIESSAISLKKLVTQILDYHKIEKHQFQIKPEKVYYYQQKLGQKINEYGPLISQKKIALDKKYLTPLPNHLFFDFNHFSQIIDNLLSNAIKFTPEGGKIEIHFSQKPLNDRQTKIMVTFIDSGEGVSADNLKKLFKPFSQISTKQTHEGSGLGLVIAQNLAQLMGGEITVKSQEGIGSEFTVSITAQLLEESLAANEKNNLRQQIPLVGKLFKNRALIIEDDQTSVILLKKWLALANFTDITAIENYPQISSLIESGAIKNYPFIIVDKNFYRANGLETIKKIRNKSGHHDTTIVFSTGDEDEHDLITALEYGASLIFPKPVNFVEMFIALEKLKLH